MQDVNDFIRFHITYMLCILQYQISLVNKYILEYKEGFILNVKLTIIFP